MFNDFPSFSDPFLCWSGQGRGVVLRVFFLPAITLVDTTDSRGKVGEGFCVCVCVSLD